MTEVEELRLELQRQFDAGKSIDERRRLGQFATPTALAREIATYAATLVHEDIDFLEPAIGTGSFYSALLSTDAKVNHATGFEIDPACFKIAKDLWKEYPIRLVNEDFLKMEPTDGKFNLLLSNPPYVRHHYIDNETKVELKKKVDAEVGLFISGLSGLYCYFMLLSNKWLAQNAVSGWLIPSEFMDVNYGSVLRNYLTNNVTLLRIHRFAPEDVQFGDALVSSAVVWFINKSPSEDNLVEFSFGGTHAKPNLSKMIPLKILKREKKWSRFPEMDVRENVAALPLSEYVTARRGIATGDNSFFILEREKAVELGISEHFLVPILPSPRKIKETQIFAESDGYPSLSTQYVLIRCDAPINVLKDSNPGLYQYLVNGEGSTANKYLCQKRNPWYSQEFREPAPILCSYMGRGEAFRFIMNESRAIATNSFLMLYPTERFYCEYGVQQDSLQALHGYLETKKMQIQEEGRVYGGGLKKVEPREIMKIDVSDLQAFMISRGVVRKNHQTSLSEYEGTDRDKIGIGPETT